MMTAPTLVLTCAILQTGLNEHANSIIIFSIESICLFELLRSFQYHIGTTLTTHSTQVS
jgi:hypothetical protein